MTRRLTILVAIALVALIATAVVALAADPPNTEQTSPDQHAVSAGTVRSHFGVFRRGLRSDDTPRGLAGDDDSRRVGVRQFLYTHDDQVCVATIATPSVPGVTACSEAATADTQPPVAILQGEVGTQVSGAAPDGVVSVTFTGRDGRIATAAVADNAFSLPLTSRYAHAYLSRADGSRIELPAALN